ncbi:hypothetical protein [Haliangium ochraceum]|uniref:Uncharacterized protein n=1 Tax=Haliangium ochraceum (strain DSM 14365 / JCM 11303 / SMP-2) TaxID=502025 RepID=D0LI87_HALO1|nr:hypothetical protein [Haliangium ochraceum]ACY16466.1 conserved hypothetical protein [Haliangium ochraceum DSM 14365]
MLDPWIIEEILRREDEKRREEDVGRLELPLESPMQRDSGRFPADNQDSESNRGVVVFDI